MPDYDPYPDAETTAYRYTGSGLKLPAGDYVDPGETVALPDRIATPLADSLVEVADDSQEDADADSDEDDEDGDTCEEIKSDGEVCGRDRPCPYHD